VRATAFVWLGRPDDLEQQLRKLATMTTPSVQDEWEMAAVSLLRGHVDDAAARFQPIIARGPVTLREIDTGRMYAQVGRMKEAADHLQHAFTLDASCAAFVSQCPAFARYRGDPLLRAALSKYSFSPGS
jgi:hypothetical protein